MKEEEIRPAAVFEKLLRLAREDIGTYFEGVPRTSCACPACGQPGELAFTKNGFSYDECAHCLTLFANPRPESAAFERYYRESQSSRFWATTFYKTTEAARREKLWRPKALQVQEILTRWLPDVDPLVLDVGAGYGVFAEELGALGHRVTVIEPAPHLAEVCRAKGLSVLQNFLEEVSPSDLPDGPKVFTSFELLEHLHDPVAFVRQLRELMETGDFFIFTTLSGTGLDIRELWDRSKSVSPPHHLNFFNPESAQMLLEKAGLTCLSTATPGVLDIDILHKQVDDVTDRFWQVFLRGSTPETRTCMQSAITKCGASSHMLIVARAD